MMPAGNRGKQMQLFVAPTPRCMKLLKYIHAHVAEIKMMDVKLRVHKAPTDPDAIKALARKGIGQTPAMIGTEGTIHVGDVKIYRIFEANFKQLQASRGSQARMTGRAPSSGDPYHDFLMKGMYEDGGNGGRVPRDDDEETDDIASSIADRTRSFEQRRKSRSRQSEPTRAGGSRRGTTSRRGRGSEPPPVDDDDDNVGMIDDDGGGWGEVGTDQRTGSTRPPRLPPRQKMKPGVSPVEMDQMMMDAWMDNNSPSGD